MKKKLLLIVSILVMLSVVCLGLFACNDANNDNPNPTPSNPTLKDFSGIDFIDLTVDYDGKEHELVVSGTLPEGTKVTYTNNKGIDVGVYNASALIECEGYNSKTLNAVLTINEVVISLEDFKDITFTDKTVVYNGKEQEIVVSGTLPQGTNVTYTNNKGTNAGEYNASVLIECEGYKTLRLNAVLTIAKATLQNITFANESFEYDSFEHSIFITGNVPATVTVVYSGGENGTNGSTNVGTYEITATIGGVNYNVLTLTAKLKITSKEEDLKSIVYDGKVYFQNPLDNNKLYSSDGTTVSFVSNDIVNGFLKDDSNMFYLSKNLFDHGISVFDGEQIKDVFSVYSTCMISDGTYLYYAVENLLKPEDNGIYKLSIADLLDASIDPTPTRLTSVRATDLAESNGYIYFSNKADSSKLYRISKTAKEETPQKVYDYKVSETISQDGILYFTRNITLDNLSTGAAIYSINTNIMTALPLSDDSTAITKISASKGKYLAIAGDYIYFVNTDMVTSRIFGDGIYRANKNGSDWLDTMIGGTKIVDGENNAVFALATDGKTLYYYRANNKHLYSANADGSNEKDLMASFVPVEQTTTIISYYEELKEHNGELYYINMRDGGKLYKYNITTGAKTRLTNLEVADFGFDGDYLYYATVRLKTNFDLYKMNLVTGSAVRISTEKCMHMSFTDDYIYYANYSGSNTLNRMDKDGNNDTIIFDAKKVNDYDTYIKDNNLYFVAGGDLYVYSLSSKTAKVLNKDASPNEYLVGERYISFMNDKSNNYFAIIDINNPSTLTNVEKLGMWDDARSIFEYNGYIYYYRNVAKGSQSKGLYRVNPTDSNPSAELVADLTGYNMSSAVVIGNKLYSMDVWQIVNSIPTPESTGKLCVMDLTTYAVEEISK